MRSHRGEKDQTYTPTEALLLITLYKSPLDTLSALTTTNNLKFSIMKITLSLLLSLAAFSMHAAACANNGQGCSPGDGQKCECNGGHVVRPTSSNRLTCTTLRLLILHRWNVLTLDTRPVSLTVFFVRV